MDLHHRMCWRGVSVYHLNVEQGLKSSIFVKKKDRMFLSGIFLRFSSLCFWKYEVPGKKYLQCRLNCVCSLLIFFFLLLFLAITFHLRACTPLGWSAVPRGVFWAHSRALRRHGSARFISIIYSTSLILY